MDARLLQLADSAFPAGTFAHSAGFEAMRQLGLLKGEEALVLRLREVVWHVASGALPFLNEAFDADAILADRAADLFLSSHVANRASRAQGQAFLMAASSTFSLPQVSALRDELPFGHVAMATGVTLRLARFDRADARHLFLFGVCRGALSASVRLGVTGPLRAQRLLLELHPVMDEALAETAAFGADDASSTSPLLDLTQAAQDRLYSRLFQS
jgi:urease accessory protein